MKGKEKEKDGRCCSPFKDQLLLVEGIMIDGDADDRRGGDDPFLFRVCRPTPMAAENALRRRSSTVKIIFILTHLKKTFSSSPDHFHQIYEESGERR